MSETTRITIIGGVSAIFGAVAGAAITGWSDLELARQKFNSDLVMKALESPSGKERIELLQFLVETNLINDQEVRTGVTAYAKSKASDPSSVPRIASTRTVAPLSVNKFQSGSYNVSIPSDVEDMWVFYQLRNKRSTDGCERPPRADPISPKDVALRMNEFIKDAKLKKAQLIFTAYSPSRGWGAASEIKINGRALQPMAEYWCNGNMNYGYELQFDK